MKELKVRVMPIAEIVEAQVVESGEGIERTCRPAQITMRLLVESGEGIESLRGVKGP